MATFPVSATPPTGFGRPVPSARMGIYYSGGTAPAFTLASALATTYTVRDYTGTVISTGAVTGTALTPTAPAGGWKCGWYRLNLTGSGNDANYGAAMGSVNFIVIRTNANFPTNPAARRDPADPNWIFQDRDQITRGVLCLGVQRHQINNAASPGTVGNTSTDLGAMAWYVQQDNVYYTAYAPASRPRPLFMQFPNGAFDYLEPVSALRFYPKTPTTDATNTTVTVAAGTSSGLKITVANGATNEVYDNQTDYAACATAINAATTLVWVWADLAGALPVATFATTAISRAKWNGVIATVQALYPLGVTRYEGPSNEPNGRNAIEVTRQMAQFQAAVKAGNASAIAVGPNPVALDANRGSAAWFEQFFAAGGAAYCDEISFHYYNCGLWDLNVARNVWAVFAAQLAAYGLTGKNLWQTEQGVTCAAFGLNKPRVARQQALMHLFLEQNGVPRERNFIWYDTQHGFWSVPCWFEVQDSLQPQAPLIRVLAEETYDRPFTSALTFGAVSQRVFLGNVYRAGDGRSTVALIATSAMPGGTVTLNVPGAASPVTVVDAWGNTSTVPVTAGKVTVTVGEVPTYVELPAGVTPTVDHCCDWPTITAEAAWDARPDATPMFGSGAAAGSPTAALDRTWPGRRDGTLTQVAAGAAAMPDTFTLSHRTAVRTDRLLIFAGYSYAEMTSLTDFDVQTSNDGSSWATVATVTNATGGVVANPDNDSGCNADTYWDERYIFDVKLSAPVTVKHVRLNVRGTSYGDSPNVTGDAARQSSTPQRLVLQEVLTLCDKATSHEYLHV